MAERIRVSGFRPPFVAPRRRDRVRPVRLVRPVNLVGLAGGIGLLAAVGLWGTPHLLLASTSYGSGAIRFYADCAYAALDGRVTHRSGPACPLFRLMREGR